MKQYVVRVLLLMLLVTCCARGGDALSMSVSSNVPRSMLISEVPFIKVDQSKVRDDLVQSIRQREIDYTWRWLQKTINRDILSMTVKRNWPSSQETIRAWIVAF